jgi:hypothetical protein
MTNHPTDTTVQRFAELGLIKIRCDDRIPEGRIMAFHPVIAERDGKQFETLPPSAVLALRKMRDE